MNYLVNKRRELSALSTLPNPVHFLPLALVA